MLAAVGLLVVPRPVEADASSDESWRPDGRHPLASAAERSLKASCTRPSRSTLSLNSSSGFLSSTMDTTISNYSHSPDNKQCTSTMICLYSGRTMFFSVSSTSREKFISYMVMSDRDLPHAIIKAQRGPVQGAVDLTPVQPGPEARARGTRSNHADSEFAVPDSDLEHAAEQLWVVGDNPSDMNDQLLLQHGLPLPTLRGAPAVDDALNHPWRQWVGDNLFFLPE
ncbi:hypothetical protein EYF80_021420 [Liparis tanakae]|uniref:Uncharacterized protein n=1 Tax=Liparis tanakae TaxID=230148 RepID=A0A4Z2HRP3_9TELE|nr:hypothetical protein EYF80_021420 [Liparis tanakae]